MAKINKYKMSKEEWDAIAARKATGKTVTIKQIQFLPQILLIINNSIIMNNTTKTINNFNFSSLN